MASATDCAVRRNEPLIGAEQSIPLDRAGMTVFRGITFLAAGPVSERSR